MLLDVLVELSLHCVNLLTANADHALILVLALHRSCSQVPSPMVHIFTSLLDGAASRRRQLPVQSECTEELGARLLELITILALLSCLFQMTFI